MEFTAVVRGSYRLVVSDSGLIDMTVAFSTSVLNRARWWEYAIRFVLGGLVTVMAGVIAKKCGPSFGGLFLAFPAILAASSTLIERHERQKKEEKSMAGMNRGREAAGADAAGAAMGSVGLIAFAAVVEKLLLEHRAWFAICAGTLTWAAVASIVWFLWKRGPLRRMRSKPQARNR